MLLSSFSSTSLHRTRLVVFNVHMVASIADKVRAELDIRWNLPEPAERRELRVRSGLSQQTIADIVGVSRFAVSQWESGARKTPRDKRVLRKYIEVLQALREAA